MKGFQALADADVVVVDRLAPLAVLDGLRGRITSQEEINEVMVSRARPAGSWFDSSPPVTYTPRECRGTGL